MTNSMTLEPNSYVLSLNFFITKMGAGMRTQHREERLQPPNLNLIVFKMFPKPVLEVGMIPESSLDGYHDFLFIVRRGQNIGIEKNYWT